MSLTARVGFVLVTIIALTGSYAVEGVAQPNAHWQEIWEIPQIDGFSIAGYCGYFFNKHHGLIGASRLWLGTASGASASGTTAANTAYIYYTEDGINWHQAVTPSQGDSTFRTMQAHVTQIRMADSLDGWASFTGGHILGIGLWKTVDAGHSWQVDSDYFSGIFDLYLDPAGSPQVIYHGPSEGRGCSVDRIDQNVLAVVNEFTPLFAYSKDGGQTWLSTTPPNTTPPFQGAWGVAGVPGWHEFICTEDGPTIGFGAGVSFDSGVTWQRYGKWPMDGQYYWEPNGGIAAGRKVVYAQSAPWGDRFTSSLPLFSSLTLGLTKSTDEGLTWKLIGGPSNDYGRRICVFGCEGASVVAFDTTGGVWLTEDGGDGSIHETFARPYLSVTEQSITSSLCAQSSGGIRFWNDHCDAFELRGITIIDSSSLAVTSGSFVFDTIPTLPKLYKTDASDSLGFRWNPSLGFNHDTSLTIHLLLRYYSETSGKEQDTTFAVTLSAHKGLVGHVLSTNLLQFDSVSTCLALDSSVTIQNIGCKSMTVDSILISGDFTLQGSSSDSLSTNEKAVFRIRFHPTGQGTRSGKLILYLNEQGLRTREIIDISGYGESGGDQLVSSATNSNFVFSDRSECALGDSIHFMLTNPGCDSLTIVSVSETGDSAISTSLNEQVPIVLFGSGEVVAQFKLTVGIAGNYQKQLKITYELPDGSRHDTTFTATASITKGGKLLLVDSSLRDLGQGDLCRNVDSIIILQNVGCDTLHIASTILIGQAYTLRGQVDPATLAPGKRDTLHVVFVPISAGNAVASVVIHSDDDRNGVVTILFIASTIDRSHFGITSSISRSHLYAGDTTSSSIYADRVVANQHLDSIEFDQVYNGDLLTATGRMTRIANATLKVGAEQRNGSMISVPILIEGTNMALDPSEPILRTTFKTFLTDSNSTSIELRDLRLNSSNKAYQLCQLDAAASSTEFALDERCGDPSIQSFLLYGRVTMMEAHPNPVTSATNFRANIEVPAHSTITIYDVLGDCLLTERAESTHYTFNGSNLKSGIYLLRATTDSQQQSTKIGLIR